MSEAGRGLCTCGKPRFSLWLFCDANRCNFTPFTDRQRSLAGARRKGEASVAESGSALHGRATDGSVKLEGCGCYRCLDGVTENGWPVVAMRMIVCPTCGNKRCPHSTDHRLACTGSNEPGQPGSRYPALPEPPTP